MCTTVPCFMSDFYVGSKVKTLPSRHLQKRLSSHQGSGWYPWSALQRPGLHVEFSTFFQVVIATHFLLASLSAQQVTMVLPLPALPVCLALVQLLSPCSATQFAVVAHPVLIQAKVGEDAELSCHLFPNMSAEHMELKWERSSRRQVVHTYAPGQEDMSAAEYGGRTSILRENITAGKAALWIRNVTASDSGNYLCHFQDGDFNATAMVELKVAGSGKAQPSEVALGVIGTVLLVLLLVILPVLLVALYYLLCPQRKKIQALCEEKERERAEKEAAQVQKEAAEAEKAAAQAEKEAAQAEKAAAQAEKEAAQWEKEAAQAKEQLERSMKEELEDKLRWRMIPYLPREEQSQAYAELKMAFFQPVDLFLDPDTAHPALCLEDQRSLKQAEAWQNLPENPERFYGNECVLGRESFTSGRHFWEVDVGDRAQWRVGVCRENVRRKNGDKMAPANGFWTVGLNPGHDYLALMDPQMTLTNVSPPERVGVFLDCELGEVSFYNAIDGSHIFTFPPTSFSGPLRPVFGISTFESTPLTICPAQKAVGTSIVPDPGPDPSLATLVSLDSAEGNGDPQAEETSLLPAAQPGAEGLLNHKTSQ